MSLAVWFIIKRRPHHSRITQNCWRSSASATIRKTVRRPTTKSCPENVWHECRSRPVAPPPEPALFSLFYSPAEALLVSQDHSRPEPASPTACGTSDVDASRICEAVLLSPVARCDALRGGFSNVVYRMSFANDHPPVLFRSQPLPYTPHSPPPYLAFQIFRLRP